MRKSEQFFLWLCAISGITFWFLIGFPFAHSHESYYWMGEYLSKSFYDFVFQPIGHYASYRPLGQVVSAALFELSGGSLFLIELFNFVLTISAVWFILKGAAEKKIFSLVFLITGGALFAAFAYLFHLHGLYYSPVLLFISVLIYYYYKPLTIKNILVTFISGLAAALFHPFAIFVYVFYTTGILIEKRNDLHRNKSIFMAGGIGLMIILSFILVPAQSIFLSSSNFSGLMNIYRSLQVNPLITIVIVGMGILLIMGISADKKWRILLVSAVILLSLLFYILKLPMMLVVFLAGIMKLINLRKWTFLALLIVTFMFSVFTDIESGHLKFYVLFVAALITSINLTLPRAESFFKPIYGSILIFVALSAVILLRNDIKIPGLSKYAVSLLATRESTYNLDKVVEWYRKSDYSKYGIELNSGRGQDIPASNINLQSYLQSLRGKKQLDPDEKLIIYFDKKDSQTVKPLFKIKGRYAKNVYVYMKNGLNK